MADGGNVRVQSDDEEEARREVRIPLLTSPESTPGSSPDGGSSKRRLFDSPRSSSAFSIRDGETRPPLAGVRFRSFDEVHGRQLPLRASRLSMLSTALSLDFFYSDER